MALRLMTFNVQMLPLAAVTVLGQSDDAIQRAERVADAILSIPADEQPHIIAFNEVFSEDGRERLKERLANWGSMVLKIDNGLLDNDSGLMLVSREPFLTLPTGGAVHERFYDESEGDDALACKAVGIVQVNRPTDNTTIAFTHLQASYQTEDEHREVRAAQFVQIVGALSDILGKEAEHWRNVILVGDLNVRGDSGAQTDEWAQTFGAFPIGSLFSDGWRRWMHPPYDEHDHDRGYTNINLATGQQQRLDYQCFLQQGPAAQRLVPHHMFVRLRDQSDHFALEAYIAQWAPHCTPAGAFVFHEIDPFIASSGTPTSLKVVWLNFPAVDAYQWIYIKDPGSYTIHAPPDLKVRLFRDDDLSHPISPADTLEKDHLPPEVLPGLSDIPIVREGQTFTYRRPFFIAVTTRALNPGPAGISVFKHLGDIPERAIWLAPHVETWSGFPLGQPLGTKDLCWFKAQMPKTFAGGDRMETFTVSNPNASQLEFIAYDAAQQPLDSVSGSGQSLSLTLPVRGEEVILFSLRRGSVDDGGFSIFWLSPVCYLALDRPIGFYVANESGPDWPGDDEIKITLWIDGLPLFSGDWGDADTGERWPGFVEAVRNRFRSAVPGMRRLPFSSDIALDYIEEDISAGSWLQGRLDPLLPTDPDTVDRRLNLRVPDTLGAGIYTFYCSISRFPD